MNLEEILKGWIDQYGLIHVDPQPSRSENGILFTAYTLLLAEIALTVKMKHTVQNKYLLRSMANRAVENSLVNGELRSYPHSTNPHMSHDNMTGVACIAILFDLRWILELIPVFSTQRMHPRDICFYAALKHPRIRPLVLWFVSLTMIISCATTYKVRNGNKIVKTDGKLLTFLRCYTLGMWRTLAICEWLLESNEFFMSFKNCFRIYFKQPKHPCNTLWEYIDG